MSSTAQARPWTRRWLARASHQGRILLVTAGAEYKLKYAGSALGYVWSVAKPLALFSMLYVVFGHIFHVGEISKYYPVSLLLGIVLFTFFSDATSMGMTSLVVRESLLRRLSFARFVIPTSATLTAAITFGVNSLVVAGFIAWNGITPQPEWLLVVPLVLELYIFILGVSLILSTLFVRLRDIGQVWELLLQLMFYASPIIYPIGFLPPLLRKLVFFNPFVQVLQDLRYVILYPDLAPNRITVAESFGHPLFRLVPIAIAFAVFAFGLWFFKREEPWFAERL